LILESETVSFPLKDALKKELPHPGSVLTGTSFDMFSIARMEGDLTPGQVEEHDHLIEKDEKRYQEWIGWQQMRLPIEHVAFTGKEKLKRGRKRFNLVIWAGTISAAAAMALILTLLRTGPGTADPDQLEKSSSGQVAAEASRAAREVEADQGYSPSGNEKPGPADEPVIHSVRRDQPPPVLTGEVNIRDAVQIADNSINQEVMDRKVQPAPIRQAVWERSCLRSPESVACDRILPLDLPAYTTLYPGRNPARYADMELSQAAREFAREKDLSLLTMASAGINGINRLTGSDLTLNVSRDGKGNATGFRFQSGWLSFAAPINNPE